MQLEAVFQSLNSQKKKFVDFKKGEGISFTKVNFIDFNKGKKFRKNFEVLKNVSNKSREVRLITA